MKKVFEYNLIFYLSTSIKKNLLKELVFTLEKKNYQHFNKRFTKMYLQTDVVFLRYLLFFSLVLLHYIEVTVKFVMR